MNHKEGSWWLQFLIWKSCTLFHSSKDICKTSGEKTQIASAPNDQATIYHPYFIESPS